MAVFMHKKTAYFKATGLLVLLLLITFAAIATAAPTPTPTATPSSLLTGPTGCVLNQMTAQQTQKFWDNTIGKAFMGQQLNEMSDAKLMNSTPKEFQSNASTAASAQMITLYPLEETSRVLGLNPSDVSNQTGVQPGGSLTYQQIESLSKKNGILDFIKKIGAVKGISVQAAGPGENSQITLPNGKKIGLNEFNNLQALNPAGCSLGNTDIDGQVSYIGVIGMSGTRGNDYDLLLAHYYNKMIESQNQYLTSAESPTQPFVAALNLGEGGANILIPHMYAKWLSAFGKINTIDMIYNLGMGATIYSQKSRIKSVDELAKTKAELEQGGQAAASIQGALQSRSQGLAERVNILAKQSNALSTNIARLEAIPAGARTPDQIANLNTFRTQLTAAQTELAPLRTQLTDLDAGITRDFNAELVNFNARAEKLQVANQQESVSKKLGEYDEIFNQLTRRATNGLILGAVWLGPARFLYSINKGLVFSSSSMNESERINYYLKIFVNKPVAEEFRSATDFLGLGTLMELVGGYFKINAPQKAFFAGNYMIINNGGTQAQAATQSPTSGTSTTSFASTPNNWVINTRWNGPSDLTVFERDAPLNGENYTSLAIESNLLPPNAIVTQADRQKFMAIGAAYSLPFLAVGKLSQLPGKVYTLVPFLLVNDYVMNIDHKQFGKVKCDEKVVDRYIYEYGAVVAIANIINLVPAQAALRTLRSAVSFNAATRGEQIAALATAGTRTPSNLIQIRNVPTWMNYQSSVVLGLVDKLMLPQVLQMAISSQAEEYVSTCYDDMYQVLSYQNIPQKTSTGIGATLTQMTKNPVSNLSSSLNIVNALQSVGQKITEAERFEILNVKAQMVNQQGVVQPADLYYLHFDTSNIRWWNTFEKKCFRQCEDSPTAYVCVDGEQGVYECDKKTGHCETIADSDRAKRHLLALNIPGDLIPNALIQSMLSCGSNKVMQIDSSATLSITDLTCSSMQCILANLQQLTGRQANPIDLTSIMGKVQKVHTTEGQIDFGSNGLRGVTPIRFVRTVAKAGAATSSSGILSTLTGGLLGSSTPNPQNLIGATQLYPNTAAITNSSYSTSMLGASTVNLYGNAAVTIAGISSAGSGEENVGTLLTIQTEKGTIDYNPATTQLTVTLYQLAAMPIEAMKGIETSIACNEVRIDRVIPRAGIGDQAAAEFNAALQRIQADCGMAVLETPDKTYYFHKDENGNQVIDICDKKTGQCTRYNQTGPARMEGDQIVFPTDKGDLKFRLFQDPATGKPMLQVTYPNGSIDLGELIAARGQNGAVYFDPRTGTWYAYNGQDIPLNPAFAQKGASFYQTPQGLIGQPSDNMVGYKATQAPSVSNKDLLSLLGLPTWPNPSKEIYAFAAMLAAIIGAVLFVRLKPSRR